MELVTQATGSLISKLGKLLEEEYKLQTGVKAQVESLSQELERVQAALRKVSQVPWEDLDEQVRLWARDVREGSYDMEDILDTFLVHVVKSGHEPVANKHDGLLKRLLEKTNKLYKKLKTRRKVAVAIKDIKKNLQEVADLRARYTIDKIVANFPDATTSSVYPSKKISIDHHLISVFYTNESSLVGIGKPRDDVVKILLGDGDVSNKKMKEVCIFGFGGLGKTTLSKAVHDKFKDHTPRGECKFAFIPVGRTPDLRKVFMDILIGLGDESSLLPFWDQMQLINKIHEFLKNERYFIVIDDVWDVTLWETIRVALKDNDLGSTIIITTRNHDVAKKVGCSYKMEPLPYEYSRILFYGTIFGSEDKCPRQYYEVCEKIMKKCGGVPLAIRTISSLVVNYKSRNIEDWYNLCDSIGSGLENSNPGLNDMRKILSLSYYDLPPYMKPCLLYLSIFPEDHFIEKNRLIWRWIAEDMVQHRKDDGNVFELGESYFIELVNRSLVQPALIDEEGIPGGCYVHDMVLDFICSLSREENFVTIPVVVGQDHFESSERKIRRLSLQGTHWPTTSMSQVRSVTIFKATTIDSMPPFSCFNLLRVLDLEHCTLSHSSHHDKLRFVGKLVHLKYLGLRDTKYDGEFPEEIEKLQLLQTLDLSDTRIKTLPSSLVRLRQLKCLYIEGLEVGLPIGVSNLTSLQVLQVVKLEVNSVRLAKELSNLTQLRVLDVSIAFCGRGEAHRAEKMLEALVESLRKLRRIERLNIDDIRMGANLMREAWVPPPCLRSFVMYSFWELTLDNRSSFSTLPTWIDPSSLLLLSRLHISVDRVRPEDIQVLGMLPALRFLDLSVPAYHTQAMERFTVSPDAFPCVRRCKFDSFVTVPSMFPRGAFPMLEHLDFYIKLDDFVNGAFIFDDLAICHLPSIRFLSLKSERGTAGEEVFTKVEETLRHHATIHPNYITINTLNI